MLTLLKAKNIIRDKEGNKGIMHQEKITTLSVYVPKTELQNIQAKTDKMQKEIDKSSNYC